MKANIEVEPHWTSTFVSWYIIPNSKLPMLIKDSGPIDRHVLVGFNSTHLRSTIPVLLRPQRQLAIQSMESLCSRSVWHRSNAGGLHVVHFPNTSLLRLRSGGSSIFFILVRNIVDLVGEHSIDNKAQVEEIDQTVSLSVNVGCHL